MTYYIYGRTFSLQQQTCTENLKWCFPLRFLNLHLEFKLFIINNILKGIGFPAGVSLDANSDLRQRGG